MGIQEGRMNPRAMTTERLIRMCRHEQELALIGLDDPTRQRSYLDELHRRQRAMCSYCLTTEQETRP
jgi:hypothetical protein